MTWAFSVLAIIVLLAVVSAWPIYDSPRLLAVAVGGALIGAAPMLLGRRMGWPWWMMAAGVAGAYVVAVVPLAIPSAMTGGRQFAGGIVEGVTGIVFEWKRLLTVSIPAGSYQGVLVPFLFIVVVCSAAATALIVFGRSKTPFATIPMAVMVFFGDAFGTASRDASVSFAGLTLPNTREIVVGVLTIALLTTWLIGRNRIERSAALRNARARSNAVRQRGGSFLPSTRRLLLSIGMVVAAVAIGLSAAPIANSFGPRDNLREEVAPLIVFQRQPSPLSSYRAWFATDIENAELFTMSAPDGVDRIRFATLDGYDGQTFHVETTGPTSQFARQPHTQEATLTLTIGSGWSGLWVPLVSADAGAPRFSGERAEALADAYYASALLNAGLVAVGDPSSPSGLREGDIVGIATNVRDLTDAHSQFATSIGGDSTISESQFPALAAWVDLQSVGRSGSDLIELVTRLRARGYLSHSASEPVAPAAWVADLQSRGDYEFQPSRAGHSIARIEDLFTSLTVQQHRAGIDPAPSELVAAMGDDEQFAAATAMLARYLGFESRIVVGVRVGDMGKDTGVLPCVTVCTGANVTSWVEVRSGGGEWLPLDVTPQFESLPNRIRAGEDPPEHPTDAKEAAIEAQEPPSARTEKDFSSEPVPLPPHTGIPMVLRLIATVLAVTGASVLVVLPLLVFPLVKIWRRRWRRSARVPEVAMVGAWQELIDTYVDLGIDVPQGLTRAETATLIDRPTATTLASIVDRAVFAEHPPSRDASARTWDILDQERREVMGEAPPSRRIRSMLSPASFARALRTPHRHHLSLQSVERSPHAVR